MAKVHTINLVGAVIRFQDIIGGVKMYIPKDVSRFLSFARDTDNNLTMIQPQGGPTVYLGSDLVEYFKDGKNRIVYHIENKGEYYLLKVDSKL